VNHVGKVGAVSTGAVLDDIGGTDEYYNIGQAVTVF